MQAPTRTKVPPGCCLLRSSGRAPPSGRSPRRPSSGKRTLTARRRSCRRRRRRRRAPQADLSRLRRAIEVLSRAHADLGRIRPAGRDERSAFAGRRAHEADDAARGGRGRSERARQGSALARAGPGPVDDLAGRRDQLGHRSDVHGVPAAGARRGRVVVREAGAGTRRRADARAAAEADGGLHRSSQPAAGAAAARGGERRRARSPATTSRI